MDPNLFHLDWERTFEVLGAIVLLAFIVERALAPFFENRLILGMIEGRGIKEYIGFGVAFLVCQGWDFDAVSTIILSERTTPIGKFITASVIAGGSKASVKLFRDVLGFRSSAYSEYRALRLDQQVPARQAAKAVGAGKAPAVEASGSEEMKPVRDLDLGRGEVLNPPGRSREEYTQEPRGR